MRFSKPTLRDSFFGWLGVSTSAVAPNMQARILNIRLRMLGELRQDPPTGASTLAVQIRYATDAQALWHCRSELMQALSRSRGEAAATAAVIELNGLFDGLVPPSLLPTRPGLGRR